MRIAFGIEHFSPRHGGAERYTWGLAEWLVARGHELHVYTLHQPEVCPTGIHIHILEIRTTAGRSRQAHFAAALSRALADESYHVVHGFNHVWPCDVLRPGGGVHLSFEFFSTLSEPSPIGQLSKQLAFRLLPRYRALRENERHQFDDPHRYFIAVSQHVAGDMTTYYPSCKNRIRVIRNGVDLKDYNPKRARALRNSTRGHLGLDEDTITFLFASNNYQLKGLYDIIRALPHVRERLSKPFLLLVVGRDNSQPFERMANRMSVRNLIHFCGSTNDMLGFYGAADVLLHPTYYDACANVCLEAMACGLPVLTSTNNGASEVMKESNGCVLVEVPCERRRFAEAIARAALPEFRASARDAQWQQAQAIPVEENYKNVLSLYEQVASEKKEKS